MMHRLMVFSKTSYRFILVCLIFSGGLFFSWKSLLERSSYQQTEDAYMNSHVLRISSKVSGYVEKVLVDDNLKVKKGELMVKIDPRDYLARVAFADAFRILAQTEWLRLRQLSVINALSSFNYDLTLASNLITRSILRLESLSLGYTDIYCPLEGKITNKRVEPGDYVSTGQYLFSIVSDDSWVVGNFKEKQLNKIRPGQPALVKIAAYPQKWLTAHVDSIQKGTKNAFSSYSPEDLTLNYVKTSQRVPVKVLLDEPLPKDYANLGPWMTVTLRVQVGKDTPIYPLSLLYSLLTLTLIWFLWKMAKKFLPGKFQKLDSFTS
ncbi:Multidrug resistance efflux pump [Methylacidiphilum infernorum V4]|uniref:Multidrug resistance efflux pump n=2 Tax=Candidatus Methylacidiphilum infernorum TaxID=511746 RepID=B3E0K4_METI4|nr:Multidrug resistance efflux pump [Methylacidiphilum infernorum V4]